MPKPSTVRFLFIVVPPAGARPEIGRHERDEQAAPLRPRIVPITYGARFLSGRTPVIQTHGD